MFTVLRGALGVYGSLRHARFVHRRIEERYSRTFLDLSLDQVLVRGVEDVRVLGVVQRNLTEGNLLGLLLIGVLHPKHLLLRFPSFLLTLPRQVSNLLRVPFDFFLLW